MHAIRAKLKEIEEKNNITILFACEAGSRAFGYESEASDRDIRFIYKHDLAWYLTVFPQNDVLEMTSGKFEFHGWDIKKALYLIGKSNPSVLEWFISPTIYKETEEVKMLRELSADCTSVKPLLFHYIKMGKSNLKAQKDRSDQKRVVYALKSILFGRELLENESLPRLTLPQLLQDSSLHEFIRMEGKLLFKREALREPEHFIRHLKKELTRLEKKAQLLEERRVMVRIRIDEVFRLIVRR
ncbi:DNA polymerase beta superfamily protein [Bacillus sp. RAR_GA_16]|uniref:nucleotidyltransferase domain-containing protein n=1 Tax=Bacillus sp. RAR_GA_16 TaxID=2876774 RepID=UPI001CCB2E21|nr:nucleotidyltransferase domain-containing protein [Bacillus sp. RAR_GA_16]MCA0171987.1 nucleotidyltransferase domain-containing protein [Bacillus sp. RAR_GA_16]